MSLSNDGKTAENFNDAGIKKGGNFNGEPETNLDNEIIQPGSFSLREVFLSK